MAVKQTDLKFNLIDGATRVLRSISRGFADINTQVAALNQSTELVGKTLGALGDGFGLRTALQEAGQFESAMAAVQAVTGATAAEFELLKATAVDASNATGASSVAAAEGLAELARAGFDAQQSIALLNPTLAIAQGQQLSVAQAAEIVTTTLTQFGLAAQDAGRVSDVLASGADKSSTSVQQLGNALSYAAPLARGLGLSLEATTAIIGELANQGFRGERAGTALRNVFSALSDPASKFSEALRAAGIQSRDFGTIIGELANGGDAAQRALLALDSEARPAILALVRTGGAGLKQLQADLEASGGAAQKTAAIMRDTFNGAIAQLTASLDNARDAFLDPLLAPLAEEIRSVAAQIQAFVKTTQFSALRDQFKDFVLQSVAAFRQFVESIDFAAVGESVAAFGRTIGNVFSGIITAIDAISPAIGKLGDAFGVVANVGETAFAGLKTAAFGALFGILEGYNALTGGTEATIVAAQTLGEVFEESAAQVRGAIEEGDAALGSLLGTTEATTVAAGGMAKAQEGAAVAVQKLGDEAATATPKVKALGDELLTVSLQEYADGFKGLAATVEQSIPAFSIIGDVARDTATGLESAEAASVAARNAFTALAKDGTATAEQLRSAFATAISFATTKQEVYDLQIELNRLGNQGRISLQDLGAASVALANKLSELAQKSLPELSDAFEQLGITSQAALDKTAAQSRLAFDAIIEGARKGEASVVDVRRAFESYARAQLAAVEGAEAWRQAEVRAALAVQADTIGATDALQRLGIAGEQAGKQAAAGMDETAAAAQRVSTSATSAAGSLQQVASAAREASAAEAEAGKQAAATASQIEDLDAAYRNRSISLGETSERFRAIYEELFQLYAVGRTAGLLDVYGRKFADLTNEMIRQRGAAADLSQELRNQIAEYENIGLNPDDLRYRFPLLSEAELIALAKIKQRVKELREETQKTNDELRKMVESSFGGGSGNEPRGAGFGSGRTSPPPSTPAAPGSPAREQEQNIRIEINAPLDDVAAEKLARQLVPKLRKLSRAGAL